jgi:hypothetical protein
VFLFCSHVNRNAGGGLPAELARSRALCPGLHRKSRQGPAVWQSSGLGYADARVGKGAQFPNRQTREPSHVSSVWQQRRERDLRTAANGPNSRERPITERVMIMSDDEWLPETEQPGKQKVETIDRRPLSERSKLSDRGLPDFRRVCIQMGILDRETDTIRPLRE